jgi:uric acid transporter
VVGFQTLSRVDFHDHRNVVIVATSVGLAMYVTAQPDVAKAVPQWAQIILGSGITLGSITAIGLNLVFFHIGKGRGPAVAGSPGDNLVRLSDVNNMSSQEFVRTFSGLFQGPDWVVERAYARRPFTDTQDLRRSFQEALFAASPDEQAQLINSYPDLGAVSVATGEEGEDSQSDQSVLGLTRLAEQEHQELASLTQAYRDRFGFTLIMAVRDQANIDQLLRHGWERLNNSPTQEHAAALIEIAKIATYRFDQLVAEANPIHSARTRHLDT